MQTQQFHYPCAYDFPNPLTANLDDDGLVGMGADLSPQTLRYAYAHGIFPWFNDGDPIMWWSPNPRCVIYPHTFSPSKSLARKLKNNDWTFTLNRDFSAVINACSDARSYSNGTWITGDMIDAYTQLHQLGDAHSVEIWQDKQLLGGLYGIKLGQAFFGESMFHKVTDASKVAFFALMKICQISKFAWVDCQLPNEHLLSLGASVISREQFLTELPKQIYQPSCDWTTIVNKNISIKELFLDNPIDNHQNRLILT